MGEGAGAGGGKELEPGAAWQEPQRDEAAGRGQSSQADSRPLGPCPAPAPGRCDGSPLPALLSLCPQLPVPLSPKAELRRRFRSVPALLLRAAHPRERLFQGKGTWQAAFSSQPGSEVFPSLGRWGWARRACPWQGSSAGTATLGTQEGARDAGRGQIILIP